MPDIRDRGKIRFGQIFQELLKRSGKNLEDHFYFLPDGLVPDCHDEKSFDSIDLRINRDIYENLFANNIPPIRDIGEETAKRLDAALVVVPGFGHHLLAERAFDVQLALLENTGFRVLYARFGNSFESNEKCAACVYDILKRELDDRENIIFLTYSKGSPVVVELLSTPHYADIASRTKAVVSFAGAIRGSLLASSSSAKATARLLDAYLQFNKSTGLSPKLLKAMVNVTSWLRLSDSQEWKEVIEKAEQVAHDLIDLPDGIRDLTRVRAESRYADVRLPDAIRLFSISAVYPESGFKNGLAFISNPDDLYLYTNGLELYKENVFNDTQVLLPDSLFYENNGNITNLGIVKTHHWGIALPRVLSRAYTDPFPRTEMLNAVILLLDEVFSQA